MELANLVKTIVQKTKEALNSRYSFLAMISAAKKELWVVAHEGFSERTIEKLKCKIGEGPLGTIILTGESLRLRRKESEPPLEIFKDMEERYIKNFLCVPLKNPREESIIIGILGVADSLTADFFTDKHEQYLATIAAQASISLINSRLINDLTEKNEELDRRFQQTIEALAAAIDKRNPYTHFHSQEVAKWSGKILKKMAEKKIIDGEKYEEEFEKVVQAGLLHDIGKIGIPDEVLLKPDKLSAEEWKKMREHPSKGAEILHPIKFLQPLIPYIRSHHEWMDGRGYPDGLKGEDIPLGARILAVADVYNALTTRRPYRPPMSDEEALEIIEADKGNHLDPLVVEVFKEVLEDEKKILASKENKTKTLPKRLEISI